MKISQLVAIDDRNKFIDTLNKSKLSSKQRTTIIRARWQRMYQENRPKRFHKDIPSWVDILREGGFNE